MWYVISVSDTGLNILGIFRTRKKADLLASKKQGEFDKTIIDNSNFCYVVNYEKQQRKE